MSKKDFISDIKSKDELNRTEFDIIPQFLSAISEFYDIQVKPKETNKTNSEKFNAMLEKFPFYNSNLRIIIGDNKEYKDIEYILASIYNLGKEVGEHKTHLNIVQYIQSIVPDYCKYDVAGIDKLEKEIESMINNE